MSALSSWNISMREKFQVLKMEIFHPKSLCDRITSTCFWLAFVKNQYPDNFLLLTAFFGNLLPGSSPKPDGHQGFLCSPKSDIFSSVVTFQFRLRWSFLPPSVKVNRTSVKGGACSGWTKGGRRGGAGPGLERERERECWCTTRGWISEPKNEIKESEMRLTARKTLQCNECFCVRKVDP